MLHFVDAFLKVFENPKPSINIVPAFQVFVYRDQKVCGYGNHSNYFYRILYHLKNLIVYGKSLFHKFLKNWNY